MQSRDCGKNRGAWFLEVGIGRGERKGDGGQAECVSRLLPRGRQGLTRSIYAKRDGGVG
jgi:hypothetical protein